MINRVDSIFLKGILCTNGQLKEYDECFCLTNTETLHRLFNNIDQHILQIIIGRVRQKHQQTVTREYFNMSLFNNMNYYYEMKRRKNTYILCVSG